MSGRRLVLVAGQIGRSGVESFCQLAGTAPSAVAPTWADPSLFAAVSKNLTVIAADSDCWIPRRAAEALTALDEAFSRAGILDLWMRSSAHLRGTIVFIPVYGKMPLPGEHPLSAWATAVRTALLDGSPYQVLIGRIGSQLTRVHLRLLCGDDDGLVILLRHPVELFLGLIESSTDGMRPTEALAALVQQHQQLERVAHRYERTDWIRYEDLADGSRLEALGFPIFNAASPASEPNPTRIDFRFIDSKHRAAIRDLATLSAELATE